MRAFTSYLFFEFLCHLRGREYTVGQLPAWIDIQILLGQKAATRHDNWHVMSRKKDPQRDKNLPEIP
jgi:hypothetical protein